MMTLNPMRKAILSGRRRITLSAGILAPWLFMQGAGAQDFLAGLPDPTRPSAPGERVRAEIRDGMILQATSVSRDSRKAVINGKTLSEGDKIEGARLVAINPYEVTLSQSGREISLRLMPRLIKSRVHIEADDYAVKP